MLFELSEHAFGEVGLAMEWYDNCSPGLGKRFYNAIFKSNAGIIQFPFMHQIVFDDIRQIKVNGFPYMLYYKVVKNTIIVLRCVHNKQKHN